MTEQTAPALTATTPALQAKGRLRGAWFESRPNQPIPEARAEVERLFAAIEAAARAAEREAWAERVLGMKRTGYGSGQVICASCLNASIDKIVAALAAAAPPPP